MRSCPGAGAAIGGALGLGTGALVGDQLQGQEQKQAEQQKAIDQQRAEIAKNQALIDELKKRNIEARETSRGVAVNLPNVNFQFDRAELTFESIIRDDPGNDVAQKYYRSVIDLMDPQTGRPEVGEAKAFVSRK